MLLSLGLVGTTRLLCSDLGPCVSIHESKARRAFFLLNMFGEFILFFFNDAGAVDSSLKLLILNRVEKVNFSKLNTNYFNYVDN